MAKYSLKARMMILILAPTLLIGLSLSVFFAVHRYHELQSQLINSGINIIEPLAIASEYGVAFHNRNAIKQLVGLLHRRHSDVVRAIAVYDAQNNLFVSSNYHYSYNLLQLPKDEEFPTHLTLSQEDNSLILRTPIIAENHLITEEPPRTLPLGYVAIELDLRLLHLQQYKESFTAFLLLLISLCIALLFAYRLMRDVTRPIRNMVNTVDRIRRGQLDSRVNGHMLGELDMLKNGINSMAMSLTAYHEEMQQNIDQATSDLRETLDQMEIQNIELDLAKRRAQEAARIKSEFLANMSHELRTPLNGVLGFTRQVLKTPLNIIQTDYLQAIEKSANNLLSIINDILDFSKLEAGKLVLEHIPFLLRETVDEVALLLAPSAHDKGLEFTLAIHQDVPEYVIGDPMRLQQIITNLLGNAIKFTEKGNIDICIEQHGFSPQQVELEFRIHDTGIGISERQQSQLFQAFRQADASISRRHGGTGLGLVITQKLVNEMGGAIGFRSQYGQGSTFWFHIKLELDPHALIEHIKMDPLIGQRLLYVEANPTAAECGLDLLHSTPLEISHLSSFEQRPPNAHYDILLIGLPPDFQLHQADHQHQLLAILSLADQVILAIPSHLSLESDKLRTLGIQSCLSKPLARNRLLPALLDNTISKRSSQLIEHQKECLPLTVMAVDDNPANLKLIGTLLNEMVTNILLCHSGEEAISQANKHSLDVILMDIQMPGLDGISTSELIRKQAHHMNTPIIAVTAHAISGERERLLQAGMDDYLAKPIDENMLRQILLRYYRQPQSVDFCATAPSPSINLYSPNQALDWRLALRQAANKEELARELLQMLLDFLPQVTLQIKSILNGEPNETIMDTIHKLHGSCSYSGVPRLKQLCYYLEQQLRHHTTLTELEPEWMELLDEIENVIQAATAKLAEH